ncbi:MAG: hypothetical protein LW710_07055 [Burkholderiales bacterium]|jgi:hypothetical protein|uniref:hypothetical protein n=1 Tax=Limnobacter sp. TaxID=2003368 RepID=UPI0039BC9A99|nr:hypothetical protein [Burkholderiales bacterium]
MDPLFSTLAQLSLGLATNAVYDLLKGLTGKSVDTQNVVQEIQDRINMYGVSMHAESVISALAQSGFLVIQQSHLHGNQGLSFGSFRGKAVVGNNSSLKTNSTVITAGSGAFLETQGNAQVRQHVDGSISFHVGDNGNVNFKVAK